MKKTFEAFVAKISSPIQFGFFLATKLPAAFFVGLKLKSINEETCVITVKHTWFSKNPFNSMYFAAEAMAAEMSIGLLAFGHIFKQDKKVSMLVIKMEANYYKKATGKISFICNHGALIYNSINEAIATGQGKTVTCKAIGENEKGEMVADFNFTWSFKSK